MMTINRVTVINRRIKADNNNKVLISISDFDRDISMIESDYGMYSDVLNLHFDNVYEGANAITEFDAFHIAQFVKQNKHTAKYIIVQSQNDVSKCIGVSAAIMKYVNDNQIRIIEANKLLSETACYNKTKAAFENIEWLHIIQLNRVRLLSKIRAFESIIEAFIYAKGKSYAFKESVFKGFLDQYAVFCNQHNDINTNREKYLGEKTNTPHHISYNPELIFCAVSKELNNLLDNSAQEDKAYYTNACVHIGYLLADAFCESGGFSLAKKVIQKTHELALSNQNKQYEAIKASCYFLEHEVERINKFIT